MCLSKLAIRTYVFSQSVHVSLGGGSSTEGGDFLVDVVLGLMWLREALFVGGVEDWDSFSDGLYV